MLTPTFPRPPPVRFYEGVLELCLTAAEKKDPQGLGPHYYKNGEPEDDRAGHLAFQDRCGQQRHLLVIFSIHTNVSDTGPSYLQFCFTRLGIQQGAHVVFLKSQMY